MTVAEYAQYLLDNFPHDAPVMDYNLTTKKFVVHRLPKKYISDNTANWLNDMYPPKGVKEVVIASYTGQTTYTSHI